MSGYAVKNNRAGWRAVDSPDQIDADEFYCLEDPPNPTPLAEELVSLAREERDRLLAIAANRIGPLQDAVDVGRVTDQESAWLLQWKSYRVDINRIEQQEGFPAAIQWPKSPDETQ